MVALAVYALAGVFFAVPFVWRGAGAIDRAAQGGTWGFRVFIFTGAAALWPFMLLKWRRAAQRDGAGSDGPPGDGLRGDGPRSDGQ